MKLLYWVMGLLACALPLSEAVQTQRVPVSQYANTHTDNVQVHHAVKAHHANKVQPISHQLRQLHQLNQLITIVVVIAISWTRRLYLQLH